MAQKVNIVLIDDVDGGNADETVDFAVDGVTYEIDLSTARAAELRAVLQPWVSRARRVGQRTSRQARGGRSSGDTAAIRAWAKAHGLTSSERGRISAEIRAKYAARSH